MSGNLTGNPISLLLNGSLTDCDFGVMEHGFAPHGRDYRFVIQDSLCRDPGTYELISRISSISITRRALVRTIGKFRGQMSSPTSLRGKPLESLRAMSLARTDASPIPELKFPLQAQRQKIGQSDSGVRCIPQVLKLIASAFR
ncbi:hypothetical protein [Occallatibacter savannae]|uniref:hypothetical protein n=1 Tax=Occallatibacter savannae TaxID=1002691 RepID=UPI0013A59B33|nr:hypothetical protein [Occallatibacter savannae]